MRIKLYPLHLARILPLGMVLFLAGQPASAISIPTGSVDFSRLASITVSLISASLVKWRTGTANQAPVPATELSFAYLQSGTNLPLPTRSNPQDNSANDQYDFWSDNAIQVNYTKGNDPSTAILIHTSNANGQSGLQNADGSSTLPVIWKAATLNQLKQISAANVNGSVKISNSSPLYMPSEISDSTGGSCPAEGPYAASTRVNNGFCDYSTHYMMDSNSSLWYAGLAGTARTNAFNYAALIGALGVNTTEQGAGTGTGGSWQPAYFVLGTNVANAIPTQYSATISVVVLSQ